jgi:anti-anti-sigma regulatory factor
VSDKLKVNLNVVNDKVNTDLEGSIDEDATFEEIEKVSGSEYIFDFDKVKMINSCGIREWIKFIEKLPKGSKIIYKKCPQIIIEQINMVHGFIPAGASIESFYAPYYDEDSDTEHKILLNSSDIKGGKAPTVKSPDSGKEMEFDAIEEQYFSFLNK